MVGGGAGSWWKTSFFTEHQHGCDNCPEGHLGATREFCSAFFDSVPWDMTQKDRGSGNDRGSGQGQRQ